MEGESDRCNSTSSALFEPRNFFAGSSVAIETKTRGNSEKKDSQLGKGLSNEERKEESPKPLRKKEKGDFEMKRD